MQWLELPPNPFFQDWNEAERTAIVAYGEACARAGLQAVADGAFMTLRSGGLEGPSVCLKFKTLEQAQEAHRIIVEALSRFQPQQEKETDRLEGGIKGPGFKFERVEKKPAPQWTDQRCRELESLRDLIDHLLSINSSAWMEKLDKSVAIAEQLARSDIANCEQSFIGFLRDLAIADRSGKV